LLDFLLIFWFSPASGRFWRYAGARRRSPGVGPIGAALLVMKAPAPELFASGRQFSAWMGLTPKDHSTAGKVRLGIITRAGDETLRSTLVQGATSSLQ
jgi:transposase